MTKGKQISSPAEKQIDKLQENFNEFDRQVKTATTNFMDQLPKPDYEPSNKLSQRDIANSKEIHLAPVKKIGCKEKFNEDFRKEYEHQKEEVQFIAENREIIGEDIELWTRPFAGMPAEFWRVPVNKPVWGPRYLAEQIRRKRYSVLQATNSVTSQDGVGSFYGSLVVDKVIQRLDAHPVSSSRSLFMGATR